MTYAIIGSGAIGTALARQFARKAIPVLIANRRGPASMAPLAEELGPSIQPVDIHEALAADTVILAVPFTAVADTVAGVTNWGGRIVIDATNAINFTDFSPADLGGAAVERHRRGAGAGSSAGQGIQHTARRRSCFRV